MQWTFIYLLTLISHHPIITSSQQAPALNWDSTPSGNYLIKNCLRANHSTEIHAFLPKVWQNLQLVLADLDHGTASRHGFRTFFKSNTNLPLAKKVFRAIADGQNLETGKPAIECLSPENLPEDLMGTYRMLCVPARGMKAQQAAALPGFGVVAICPLFWKDAFADFPENDDCIEVGGRRGRRRFLERGGALGDTRFSALVHELVHLYNPMDAASKVREVYDAQECVELDARRSVGNAENWAYYADSVVAGCTKFPLLPIKVNGDLRI
ncbi:MAG: hypothetical protein Q9170_006228 [Blastenia crenularia]